jgi:hypothetical protein
MARSTGNNRHIFALEGAVTGEVHPEVSLGGFLQHRWCDLGSGFSRRN